MFVPTDGSVDEHLFHFIISIIITTWGGGFKYSIYHTIFDNLRNFL
jgi:hypothetical protein